MEKRFPRLVSLPHVVVPCLCEQDRSPNELQFWIDQHIARYIGVARRYWYTMYKFSIAASQEEAGGNAVLASEENPVMVTDAEFFWWMDMRLDSTLG